jgi:hypothetical protein
MLEHVRLLASDELEGRGTGTAGQKGAAIYLAAAFRRLGLEPLDSQRRFLQEFEVRPPSLRSVGPATGLRLRGPGGDVRIASRDVQPLGSSGRVEGPLVFVGYSIADEALEYDDFEGVDVRGAIALALRHTPGEGRPDSKFGPEQRRVGTFASKGRAAAAAGARGLVVVNDPLRHDDDEIPALAAGFGEDPGIPILFARRAPVEEAVRACGLDLREAQQAIDENLRPHSRRLEGIAAEIVIEMVAEEKPKLRTENVLGLLRGSDPVLSEECVVLGAHYDHVGRGGFGGARGEIHNGADDNASGTAGLLAVAEALARAPRPKRSIVFAAFGAEEMGLLGSRHWCENPLFPLDRTVAMVNLDMIGRSKGGECEVGATGTSPDFEPLVTASNEGIGLSLSFQPGVPADSDHYSFHEKGIPVLFFFTGFHEDYHRPGDDWEKINAEDGARIAKLACKVVLALADDPQRPRAAPPPGPPRQAERLGRRRP